jgi:hypothetical protein
VLSIELPGLKNSRSIAEAPNNSVYLLGMVHTVDLLTSTPGGSIAETPINSVYLLGMVCIRALIC